MNQQIKRYMVLIAKPFSIASLGYSKKDLVAVVANKVLYEVSDTARNQGIVPGLKVRSAQAKCPELKVVKRDKSREVTAFENVLTSLDQIVAQTCVTEVGMCIVEAKGPTRLFGGEEQTANKMLEAARRCIANTELSWSVGIGDGLLPAKLAAEKAIQNGSDWHIVPSGQSPEFLSNYTLDVLCGNVLPSADLLKKIGVKSVGQFAAMEKEGQFGDRFVEAGKLARCEQEEGIIFNARNIPKNFKYNCDPPLETLEKAAFIARPMATELMTWCRETALRPTTLKVEIQTDKDSIRERSWSLDDRLDEKVIVERLRWQLEAWLSADQIKGKGKVNIGAIVSITIYPMFMVPFNGVQINLNGRHRIDDDKFQKTVAKIEGMLQNQLSIPIVKSGRLIQERQGYASLAASLDASAVETKAKAFPGALIAPYPATVLDNPLRVHLLDKNCKDIDVNGQAKLLGKPFQALIKGIYKSIKTVAGPWPTDEQWWSDTRRRVVQIQVLFESGEAVLLARENKQWWLWGIYD